VDARAVRPNGNVGQRMLPNEPMAMVFNLGLSNSFVQINWTGIGEQLPATMRFDYVRLYQEPNSQSVTCDPENYPTTSYIKQFSKAYQDQNVTSWYVSAAAR
jgi:beta-glucan synthesis-associated protein KRE6